MDESDEYPPRRPRSRNWNVAEKFFLFEHVKNKFDTITDPRKEATFIHAKRKAWEQIYHAFAKKFGPLEEHLVKGKGGEKCRTQWKHLVHLARKDYKKYMEAQMMGKRHNMTLLSRKICRLMSIDLDDTLGGQEEEGDWTEEHPEFRYQPELCLELKEMAEKINAEYEQGQHQTPTPDLDDDFENYEEANSLNGEDYEGSDTYIEDNDEKDEDYSPEKRYNTRKRKRAKSPVTATTPKVQTRGQTRSQTRSQSQSKAKAKTSGHHIPMVPSSSLRHEKVSDLVGSLSEDIQKEILSFHRIEHKRRIAMMATEHRAKMQVIDMEKVVMGLKKAYWSCKWGLLAGSKVGKRIVGDDEVDDEDDEDDDDDTEDDVDEDEGAVACTSGTSSATAGTAGVIAGDVGETSRASGADVGDVPGTSSMDMGTPVPEVKEQI